MKIIIASTPVGGHLNPLLGIARLLVKDGHDVVIYSGSTLAGRAVSVGARLVPLPSEVDYDLSDVDKAFPGRRHLSGPERMTYDFGTIFLGSMTAQNRGLQALLREFPADLVISEHLFFGIVPLLCQPRDERPPVLVCGISFLALDRADGLPHGMGLPFVSDPVVAAAMRDQFLPAAAAVVGPLQAKYDVILRDIGCEPQGGLFSATTQLADMVLQAGISDIEYPRPDWPAHMRFVRAWPSAPSSAGLPEWANKVDDARKVVLVTQGTVANADSDQLILPAIQALAQRDDILVIVSFGGAEPILQADIPANVRLARYLPYDWLMPKLDLFITNGGFGAVDQALAEGVPILIAGTSEDKPEIAARIAWSGAGINLNTDAPEQHILREAAFRLLDDPAFRGRAQELAQHYRATDSEGIVRQAVDMLTRNARAPSETLETLSAA